MEVIFISPAKILNLPDSNISNNYIYVLQQIRTICDVPVHVDKGLNRLARKQLKIRKNRSSVRQNS